jgi:hypothetical protein
MDKLKNKTWQKIGLATFWVIFSQTQLVTLIETDKNPLYIKPLFFVIFLRILRPIIRGGSGSDLSPTFSFV